MNCLLKVLCSAIVCWFLGNSVTAAQTSPSLAYQLRSKDFENSNSAQLLVTADIPTTFEKVDVQFVTPPEFVAEPTNLTFDANPGKRIVAVIIRRVGDPLSGDYAVLVHATAQPSASGSGIAIDQVVNFTYTKRLQVKFYFIFGLLGFIVGYLLRIVTGVLKQVPAPVPLAETDGGGGPGKSGDGPITAFVKQHYYRVDFSVSLVLAFVVLLYLMREGHPPDSAAAWYGALLTGIGLGFLTNNDLLARIRA